MYDSHPHKGPPTWRTLTYRLTTTLAATPRPFRTKPPNLHTTRINRTQNKVG